VEFNTMLATHTKGKITNIEKGIGTAVSIDLMKGRLLKAGRTWLVPHREKTTMMRSKTMAKIAKLVENRRSKSYPSSRY
jgi:hypothetical protein